MCQFFLLLRQTSVTNKVLIVLIHKYMKKYLPIAASVLLLAACSENRVTKLPVPFQTVI